MLGILIDGRYSIYQGLVKAKRQEHISLGTLRQGHVWQGEGKRGWERKRLNYDRL